MTLSARARKTNRLRKYDYSQSGWYYVTICTKNKEEFFGKVVNGNQELNKYGDIAVSCWKEIPIHFSHILLDEFIIMPNHIHGIIAIQNQHIVGNNDRCSLHNNINSQHNNIRNDIHRNMELLPKIISQYKSSVSRFIRKKYFDSKFGWQKSYYDRIIRNEYEYIAIRQYIKDNPKNWEDGGNPEEDFIE